jgi:hypothetical protein
MPKKTFIEEPYFDDFDYKNNFQRVLFKPKAAVQTRELNQIQSIFSNQIGQFANHIFKHGSKVNNSIPKYDNTIDYIMLKDFDIIGEPVKLNKLHGRKIRGRSTGILADVILTSEKTENDQPTIFVSYLNSGGTNKDQKVFLPGEKLDVLDDNGLIIYTCEVQCESCDGSGIFPTGKGSIFTVSEGIYYVYGEFIYTPNQIIILEKYKTDATYDVGFDIIQEVVGAEDDESLYDNALGYPNHNAPGADRYKISLLLNKRINAANDSDNWVLIAKINYGVLQEIKDKPQYAEIEDMIARRTFDESGNYSVKPFLIKFKEMMKSSPTSNDGYVYPTDDMTEDQIQELKDTFVGVFTPGKAYVRGREIEKISDSVVEIKKARDLTEIKDSAIRIKYGNYIYITLSKDSSGNVVSGVIPLANIEESNNAVDFELVDIMSGTIDNGIVTGVKIGEARIKAQDVYQENGADTIYRLFLFDVKMNTGEEFGNARAIYKNGDNPFYANIVDDGTIFGGTSNSVYKIYEPTDNNLLYELPYKFTKNVSIKRITTRKKFYGTTDGAGVFSFGTGVGTFEKFNPLTWICGVKVSDSDGKYYPFQLTTTNLTINSDSKSGTIQTPYINKKIVLICDVTETNVPEITKTLTVSTVQQEITDITKVDTFIMSGIYDFIKLKSVYVVENGQLTENITDFFEIISNVYDNYYKQLEYKIKDSKLSEWSGTKTIQIEVEHFSHSGAGNGFFYSPSSYSSFINSEEYDYEDIPEYTTIAGDTFKMFSVLDFRPDMSSNISGNEFVNTTFIPSVDTNIVFDIEFYSPRVDKIVIDEHGNFIVVKGVPTLEPKTPIAPEKTMPIYDVYIDAYTFDIKKDVRTKFYDNRRFTMRDIGKIEKRVDNLEEYVTLSMLELDTLNLEIKDVNGNNRFKNGLIVDNFTNFIAANTESNEYSATLDIANEELRPSYYMKENKFELDILESQNFKVSRDIITQNYENAIYKIQNLSSKTISVNPYFIFNWVGEIALDPEMDMWKDTEQDADIVVDIDAGFDGLNFLKGEDRLTATWDGWQAGSVVDFNIKLENETTKTIQKDLGERVTDVNLIPYIRQQTINFVASSMRPNTQIYAFFDNEPVSKYCKPYGGSLGEPLVTDENGQIAGSFEIPNNDELKFFVGDRIFRLTDSETDSKDKDEVTTSANTKFWAGGIKINKQDVKLNINTKQANVIINNDIAPTNSCVWQGKVYNEDDRLVATKHTERWVTPPGSFIVDETPFGDFIGARCSNGEWVQNDPIAQSFTINDPNGVFVTKLDIFFEEKSKSADVWVEIREMVNGYPSSTVLKYSHVVKRQENVLTSTDGSIATTFEFEAPVYLNGNGTEYCFVIGSTDPEYRVYVAELGEKDKISGGMITTQPAMGSLFKSQNASTWNAEQYEDIKFTLYNALFDKSDMVLKFKNTQVSKVKLGSDPFETENGLNQVRVYHKGHGLIPNDKVELDLFNDLTIDITVNSGYLLPDQYISSVTTGNRMKIESIRFKELASDGISKIYTIKYSGLTGNITSGEDWVADVSSNLIESKPHQGILDRLDVNLPEIKNVRATGAFNGGIGVVFNGIPFSDFMSDTLTVKSVDSMDSYIIETQTPATKTGRCGGTGVLARGNIQIDVFQVQCDVTNIDSTSSWVANGIAHSGIGSKFSDDYLPVDPIECNLNQQVYLERPWKLANENNESENNVKSITMAGSFKTINGDIYVSPIVNLNSFSFVGLTNKIDWNDVTTYSIAPNATTDGNPLIEDVNDPAYNGRWTPETNPGGGNEKSKYLIKKVSLTNPATSLKVLMDVYKPIDSEINVYYKYLPVESNESLQTQDWILVNFDEDVTSEHEKDFREVTITIGDYPSTPLPDFKDFVVKLVLRSKNSSNPPKVKRFRAIAVI